MQMRRSLIAAENTLWQNAWGVLAAAILIPIVIVLKLVTIPFERPIRRTPDEVAAYLRDFIQGTGGDWDWDDFVSIPIADPKLESIRARARDYPATENGLAELKALLREAEALMSQD